MSTSAYPPLPDGNEESEAAAAAAAVRPGSSRSVKAEQHTGGFGSPDGGAGDGTRALRAVSPLTAAAQAAHQGLAALQAATAARMQQQAQQAEQHPLIAIAPGPGGHAATAAAGEMPVDAVNVGVPGGNRYAAPAPSALAAPAPQKHRRLRRACDMCSSRKIRCDEAGPPCAPCRELGVECTFMREMKRRGPPNRHAEAARLAKRQRMGELGAGQPITPSPQHAAETLVTMAGLGSKVAAGQPVVIVDGVPVALDAEAIAPWPVLELLVDDFFTYIHPLTPFPHEPTFREAFRQRRDRTDRGFLALLASMVGCLVASFPRPVRLRLKAAEGSKPLFPHASGMIERCRAVALEARGAGFAARADIDVNDAATSYFLGLAAGYSLQWKLCHRFFAETLTFIRELGVYQRPRDEQAILEMSATYGVEDTVHLRPFDHITDQIGKRIFWVMLLGVRTMEQLGASFLQLLLAPPTPTDPYPELPVEVDDEYILPDRILEQPPGQLSLMTGFIHAIKIYMTMNPLVSIEISYGLSTLGWPDQKAMLSDCLTAVKSITDELPPELQLETQVNGNQDGSGAAGEAPEEGGSFRYMPPTFPEEQPADDLRNLFASDPARRRQLQYGIQKANIYSSQLATRSFYVERYLTLRDVFRASQVAARFAESSGAADKPVDQKPDVAAAANGKGPDEAAPSADATNGVTADTVAVLDEYIDDGIDTAMVAERELIVQSLLAMVETLPPRMMEPNGGSLVNKVRLVASTLLNDPAERKGPQAVKAEAQLQAFLAHLVRLDKTSAVGGPGGGDEATAASAGPVDDKVGVAAAAGAAGACEGEEAELRLWAGLRDHNQSQQARFPSGNGTFLPA